MREKRKSHRLNEFNEITVSIISEKGKHPEKTIPYSNCQDISASGARIRGNIRLPVDSLLKIDFAINTLEKQITAFGKVKWIKILIEDKYYEVGIEFVDTPAEAVEKIREYILWKDRTSSLEKFVMRVGISTKVEES